MNLEKWNRIKRKSAHVQLQRIQTRITRLLSNKLILRPEEFDRRMGFLSDRQILLEERISRIDGGEDLSRTDPLDSSSAESEPSREPEPATRQSPVPDFMDDMESAPLELQTYYETLLDQERQESGVRIEELEEEIARLTRNLRQMVMDHEETVAEINERYENRIDLIHLEYDTEFDLMQSRVADLTSRIETMQVGHAERERNLRAELWRAHIAGQEAIKELQSEIMEQTRRYRENMVRFGHSYQKLVNRYEDGWAARRFLERKLKRQQTGADSDRPADGWNVVSLNEKRRAPRFPVNLAAVLEEPESIQPRQVSNISQGGCFIKLSRSMVPDTPIRFRLSLDLGNGQEEIGIHGKVTYSVDDDHARTNGGLTGVGVELTDFPTKADQHKFHQWMSRIEGVS